MCDRAVCDEESEFRIFNAPSTELGYRTYCKSCTNRIISANVNSNEFDKSNPLLKWEKIHGDI